MRFVIPVFALEERVPFALEHDHTRTRACDLCPSFTLRSTLSPLSLTLFFFRPHVHTYLPYIPVRPKTTRMRLRRVELEIGLLVALDLPYESPWKMKRIVSGMINNYLVGSARALDYTERIVSR